MTIDSTPPASVPVLVGLDSPAAQNRELCGNKAATLAVLRGLGFRVPSGVILTTETLRRSVVDASLANTLASVPDLLGPGPYAVRSSGSAEDGRERSFAGQFTTLLDVTAADLPDAVRRVWSSRESEHITEYRGAGDTDAMAVLDPAHGASGCCGRRVLCRPGDGAATHCGRGRRRVGGGSRLGCADA